MMISLGSLCGVQNGLESAMNLLKFILVIRLPDANTSGIIIILSFVVRKVQSVFSKKVIK